MPLGVFAEPYISPSKYSKALDLWDMDTKANLWWEDRLKQQIAKDIAREGSKSYEVALEVESIEALVGLFDASAKVHEKAVRNLSRELNSERFNLAALDFLPTDWSSDKSKLHVLSLVWWGVAEGRLAVPQCWDSVDDFADLVLMMYDWNPAYVVAVLKNPESPWNSDEEFFVGEAQLEACNDALEGAALLLESLKCAAKNGFPRKPSR